mgnify:CR=1 FL=1
MNAYEFADKLEQQFPENTAQRYLDGEAANMLRQQADRIKKLEEEIQDLKNPILRAIALAFDGKKTKPLHEDIVYGLCYKYGIEKGDVLDFARAIEERHGIK